jgi:hypothetical protein
MVAPEPLPSDPVYSAINNIYSLSSEIEYHTQELKRLRQQKQRINDWLCNTMREREVDVVGSALGRTVRLRTKREYGSLTFKYIDHCLKKVTNKQEIIDRIMTVLRENRTITTTYEAQTM